MRRPRGRYTENLIRKPSMCCGLKEILKSPKTNVQIGSWSTGHVPRNKFPLSRARSKHYRFGPDYQWRIVTFEAAGNSCRILILLNEYKETYRARLAVEKDGDMLVLCEHEYHATEAGWHCHVTSEPISSAPVGAARYGKTKWPNKPSRLEFGVTKANALAVAAKRFGFEAQGELL